ncbi:glycoside hydrolase family 3 protein [Glutamicibacter sp. NPDC087344]|uniref:glycoside hydrolase family 3 protein n=1 Tax=Glutamicibacter sp. NPDC087344 TaxID=3363994 RepID=UPI0037FEF0CC
MTVIQTLTQQAQQRVASLDIAEKVGLLFHPMIMLHPGQDFDSPSPMGPSLREIIVEKRIRFLCLATIGSPEQTAEMIERCQEFARAEGSGIPLVFSTDPRHSFIQNDGASHRAQGVSQWPEPIGLGAINDPDEVRRFGEIVRKDYRAMGIRMGLHPQVDLTTDARWARQAQSFGTTAAQTSRLLEAYLRGLQGENLSSSSVAAVIKHFPGGGAQLNGEDPHFPYGREQVYPAGKFEEHLEPFRTAIDAGAEVIMPYYGMPMGLTRNGAHIAEVAFGYNKQIITGLLREELGYQGMVLSDFGLVTDVEIFGKPFPSRAWGVEHLSIPERYGRLLDAGIDQFGGEHDTASVLQLIADGALAESTVDRAATRVMKLMLRMGVFADASDDITDVRQIPARADVEAGARAQSRAVTILKNDSELLPLAADSYKVYVEGIDSDSLPASWQSVPLEQADLAILRRNAPFEPRDTYFLEQGMQQGSLEFESQDIAHINSIARAVPTVLVVCLARPAILTPVVNEVRSLVAEFGVSDLALIDAITGSIAPEGRLPFEIPRTMKAVEEADEDAGANTQDPLFPLGYGLDLSIPVVSEYQ